MHVGEANHTFRGPFAKAIKVVYTATVVYALYTRAGPFNQESHYETHSCQGYHYDAITGDIVRSLVSLYATGQRQ